MASVGDRGLFEVNIEEVGHAILLRTFRMIGSALGDFVMTTLKRVYGELQWRRKAGEAFTKGTFKRLEDTEKRGLNDVWLATELILHNLEVFQREIKQSCGMEESVRLERLAVDVDCVNRTRTYLFHDMYDVSPNEVMRCIWCLENTWRSFASLEKRGAGLSDDLHEQALVRRTV